MCVPLKNLSPTLTHTSACDASLFCFAYTSKMSTASCLLQHHLCISNWKFLILATSFRFRLFYFNWIDCVGMDLEKYHLMKKIGCGSYGQVYKAEEKATGRALAVKLIDKVRQLKGDWNHNFIYEIRFVNFSETASIRTWKKGPEKVPERMQNSQFTEASVYHPNDWFVWNDWFHCRCHWAGWCRLAPAHGTPETGR